MFNWGHVAAIHGPVRRPSDAEASSDAPDRASPKSLTALFVEGAYKYLLAGLWLTLLAFLYTWHPCEPKQTLPTHLHQWLTIIVRMRMIPSAFDWVIAFSGTSGSFELWISCYSWWLSPPRRLGAVEEHWHELVIVRGHLLMIVSGLVPSPVESRNVTLVNCLCHWVTSLVSRFLRLRCPNEDEVHATPLSHWTTKCWSTQQELLVSTSTWTSGEKSMSQLWLFGILPVIVHLYIGDWFIPYTTV